MTILVINTITIHGRGNNKNRNPQNCKVILKIQYLGIVYDNNLRWTLLVNNLRNRKATFYNIKYCQTQ